MRKKVTLAKKQLLQSRRLQLVDLIDNYTETYRELRNSYISKIKRCKRESWQNFVNTERNKDPWGIVYKIVRDKFQKPSFSALKLPDGQRTISIGATVEALLNKCAPAVDADAQSEGSSTMKQKLRNYYIQKFKLGKHI